MGSRDDFKRHPHSEGEQDVDATLDETVDLPKHVRTESTVDFSQSDASTVPPLKQPAALTLDRDFGDYELLEEVARGGMGVVYKARHKRLNRVVALKMILAGEFAGDDEVRRFHSEAEAAANLEHQGIVPIFEVGEFRGRHFFAMAYVDGVTLSNLIKDGPLDSKDAAQILFQIVDSIAYAHEHGVIHRDLKPGNILLTTDRQARVTDFGLAKRIDSDSDLTDTGQVLGTPSYMAPEQAAGRIDQVGKRADIYALGAILYYLLTGRPPFQSANPIETIRQVLEREPVAPRSLNPAIDRDLETICLKCLNKEPSKRYASASALAAEIERYLTGRPIIARPLSQPARFWRWCRRNPVIAASAGVIATVLIVATIISTWFGYQSTIDEQKALTAAAELETQIGVAKKNELLARKHEKQAKVNETQAKWSERKAKEQESIAKRNSYVARIRIAGDAWERGDVASVRRILDSVRPDPGEPDFRRWEWYYLDSLTRSSLLSIDAKERLNCVTWLWEPGLIAAGRDDGSILLWDAKSGEKQNEIEGHTGPVTRVAWNDRLKLLATGGEDNTVRVWDETWTCIFESDAEQDVTDLSWNRAGSKLAWTTSAITLSVLNWESRDTRQLLDSKARIGWIATSLAWRPDGKQIAISQNGVVKVLDAIDGSEIAETRIVGNTSILLRYAMDWKNDGSELAVTTPDGSVRIVDAVQWREKTRLLAHKSDPQSVMWSTDGRLLASAGMDRIIRLWDVKSGREMRSFRGHGNAVAELSWDAEGKSLASVSIDGTMKTWDVDQNQTSRAITAFDIWGSHPISAAWHPQGDRLLTTSVTASGGIVPLGAGGKNLRLSRSGGSMHAAGWSPDGEKFASSDFRGAVNLWASEGRKLGTVGTGARFLLTPYWFPDSRRVLSASGGNLVVIDTKELQIADKFPTVSEGICAIACDSAGKLLAAADISGTVTVWREEDKQEVAAWKAHDGYISTIVWQPNSNLIATAGWDRKIGIWNSGTGEQVAKWTAHTGRVSSIDWSPDGDRLASTSGHWYSYATKSNAPQHSRLGEVDTSVKLWDPQLAEELLVLRDHGSMVFSVDWSLDGKRLVTTSRDMTMRIWGAPKANP